MKQQAIDILLNMKATREEFIKPYNENSIEYIKTKESIMTIDEMIFRLGDVGDGWIPLTPENLPEEGEVYLVFAEGVRNVCCFNPDGKWSNAGIEFPLQVTHYQSLPLPPNK